MPTPLFKPGQSGSPAGRPPGAKDKVNAELKDMIRQALDQAGGVSYLARIAEEQPVAFLALIGKILPKELAVKQDGLLNIFLNDPITRVEYVVVDPNRGSEPLNSQTG